MSRHRLLIPLLLFFWITLTAHATPFTINITFDSSVTSDPRAAQIEAAVNYVVGEYESLFTNPITVNITVAENTTGLGESETFLNGNFSYAAIRSALIADATAGQDTVALDADNDLPLTDPTGSNNYWLPTAEAKALGLLAADNPGSDGTFLFNSTQVYTFDPNNRGVAGEYDFIGIAEHEISEIMGRIPGLGTTAFNGSPAYLPFDLFRYTAPGVSGVSDNGAGVYFSTDNGVTNLQDFNSNAADGGDPQDWLGQVPTDPYDYATGTGQAHALTSVDLTAMNVVGYNEAVPEPSTGILFTAGLFAVVALARKPVTAARNLP